MYKFACFFVALIAITQADYKNSDDRDVRNSDFNTYYVQTPETREPTLLTDDNMSILTNRTTVILIHEHRGNFQSAMNIDISKALIQDHPADVNLLIVDWSVQASFPYSNADSSVPTVGRYVADYLSSLSLVDVTPEFMHIVGFNLGAHIAGWAGRSLRERGAPVARITALDPSKCNHKIAATDAEYVEVIHTDADGIFSNGIGDKLGHADFYPNGGGYQPGCWGGHTCSHNRAYLYFAASLGYNNFTANCCNTSLQLKLNNCRGNSVQDMGNNRLVKISGSCGTGIYRVNTRSSFPY